LAGSPGLDAEIFAAVFRRRLKVRADAYILVGARAVRFPENFAGVRIERGQLTANAKFRAAVAHENDVVDHVGAIVMVSP
jgi:hypothetical protein